jgi:integrase
MGITWIQAGRGIRYWEHQSRKHGLRADRYWCIRYKLNGKDISEAVGWWSQGASQAKCETILGELRRNHRSGLGPQTLREMTAAEIKGKEAAAETVALKNAGTFAAHWEKYLEYIQGFMTRHSISNQKSYKRNWLHLLDEMPLAAITTGDLERLVVAPMLEAGKKPNTIEHALAIVSAIWNRAKNEGLVEGSNPKSTVSRPRTDSRRVRFLSQDEAARLLAALKEYSVTTHDLALLSLFSGMRAGECMRLTWADVDFENGILFVKDTKNKHNRHAYMTKEIRSMLTRRHRERKEDSVKVFIWQRGGVAVSLLGIYFNIVIKRLGFNDGIDDPRQRVVFHRQFEEMPSAA